jgi:hypothetical protein
MYCGLRPFRDSSFPGSIPLPPARRLIRRSQSSIPDRRKASRCNKTLHLLFSNESTSRAYTCSPFTHTAYRSSPARHSAYIAAWWLCSDRPAPESCYSSTPPQRGGPAQFGTRRPIRQRMRRTRRCAVDLLLPVGGSWINPRPRPVQVGIVNQQQKWFIAVNPARDAPIAGSARFAYVPLFGRCSMASSARR